MLPTQLGKELTKEEREKIGNGNSHSCLVGKVADGVRKVSNGDRKVSDGVGKVSDGVRKCLMVSGKC